MRTEKELLQVLLDNMDKFENWLCKLTYLICKIYNSISYEEGLKINTYIKLNAPKKQLDFHHWTKGEKQPRIDWLNKQINKL